MRAGDGTGGKARPWGAHRGGPIPMEEAALLAKQIAEAPEYAHEESAQSRNRHCFTITFTVRESLGMDISVGRFVSQDGNPLIQNQLVVFLDLNESDPNTRGGSNIRHSSPSFKDLAIMDDLNSDSCSNRRGISWNYVASV